MARRLAASLGLLATASAEACDVEGPLPEVSLLQIGQPTLYTIQDQRLLPPAETLPDAAKSFMDTLRICGQCSSMVRLGEANDGGYVTCMDGMENTVAALSLGVEHHDKWSDHVQGRFDVPVAQFDCTVDKGADCHTSKCSFFKTCIVSATNSEDSTMTPRATMAEAMRMAGVHEAPDRSLLLKMDIEGSEWPILSQEPPENLRKFHQIILELHDVGLESRNSSFLNVGNLDKMRMYDRAMRNLFAAGFRVVHVHGNNNDLLANPAQNVMLPNALEVTLSVHATERPECLRVQEYLPGLDAPDAPSTELPLMRLPGAAPRSREEQGR